MPEKKPGVFDIIRGVFKIKRPICEDIVRQADRIVADYVAQKRGEILSKYKYKKRRLRNCLLILGILGLLFFLYALMS